MKTGNWSSFKNILCIRLDNLGDVLMTTPAIRALKEAVPGRKITLLTSSAGNLVSPFIPEIDESIVFDTPWTKNKIGYTGDLVSGMVLRLKELNFDAAVIFNVYSQSPLPAAMLCYQAGIPRVAAYCRENPYHLITDWIPDPEPLSDVKHEVIRQTDLVRNLGAVPKDTSLSLLTTAGNIRRIRRKLQGLGFDPDKEFLVMHPGVSDMKRQYPVQLFAEAARKITVETGFQVLLTGVLSEKELTDQIVRVAGRKAFSLAGRLDMEELIALIKAAPLLISNNTGPVHIAAAVQTPVIVLYALTNPQHAPWNVRHRILPFDIPEEMRSKNVIIRYANSRCFKEKSIMPMPGDILRAAGELLAGEKEDLRTEVLSV